MKISLIIILLSFSLLLNAQSLKPYTTGAITTASLEDTRQAVSEKLSNAGFQILGEYQPASDPNRWVIVYTSDDILSAVQEVGGLSGFAAAWRVGLTNEGGKIRISYNTPMYWGNAYFQKDFSKVKDYYKSYDANISNALSSLGTGGGEMFGSKSGKTPKQLQNYQYKMMMPHFDDTQELGEFDSYKAAVNNIDRKLTNGVNKLKLVYSIELAEQKLKLYGIATSGEKGESSYITKIDKGEAKHTAFFPYEILVNGRHVYMLHGRYRIAISFPDTSMGEFMDIMSAPGDVQDLLQTAVIE